MPTEEFKATQGLLHDDMRKQAGRIEKSWLEAVMNSVDAGATEFKAFISEESTELVDDGSGMDNHEINTYFKNFGYKDDDVEDKVYGKFRRGRGQIFNFGKNIWHTQDNVLVVDLDNDTAEVEIPLNINPDDNTVVSNDGDTTTLDTEGYSYNHQKAQEECDGTRIFVEHYKPLDDVSEKVHEFKRLVKYISWMHDIDIYVNDEKVDSDFQPDFTTEYGYFQYGDKSIFSEAATYNLGAYVDDIGVKDSNGDRVPVSGVIISREELDLNNARTEIIEGDEVWEQIKEDYIMGARHVLAERQELSKQEKKWLIKQAKEDQELMEKIEGRAVVEDINGDGVTIQEITSNDFAFAPEGNALAQEVMNRGDTLMIDDSYKRPLDHLAGSESPSGEVPEGKEYSEAVENEMSFEMQERDVDTLSKRRRKNLRKLQWFLREIDVYDTLKPGYSKHENVWRTDSETIMIDEDFLNSAKNRLITEVVDELVKIAAADGDTRSGLSKDSSYKRKYTRLMQKTSKPRKVLLEGREDMSNIPQLTN